MIIMQLGRLFKIKFINGDYSSAFSKLKEGQSMVVPSGPGLATIDKDKKYYRALQAADFAIADSGFMVILLRLFFGYKIKKLSGLKFFREFVKEDILRKEGALFCVDPSESELQRNNKYLNQIGIPISIDYHYIAPHYSKSNIEDFQLLSLLESLEKKPRFLLLNLGGGIQERLAFFIRNNLSYKVGIICTGAAIAFETGSQAKIPVWVDEWYLGWLARVVQNPARFAIRFLKAFRLIYIFFLYRKEIRDSHLDSSIVDQLSIGIIGTRGIPNHYGGFEQVAEYLSVGLVSKGHKVVVYNSHNHPYQENKWNGVDIIHCYDPEYLIGTSGQFFYDLNSIFNSRKQDFDIILQLGYTSSTIWHRFMPTKPILITNMDGIEWKRSKYSNIVQRFLKYAEGLAVKHSDYFIADSIGMKKYLNDTYKIEATYIPYGAEPMKESNLQDIQEYGLKEHNYDIIIARMESENNIEMILEGFFKSRKERDLVIVGDLNTTFGKYVSEKYNSSCIKYVGFIADFGKLNSLRDFSNLYFHGHSVGGTNPSLLEAMASNSLICAHDNIFNKSILGDDAFYFQNSQDVSELIDNEVKNQHKDILNINQEKTRNLYSWKKIVNDYHSFFQKIS